MINIAEHDCAIYVFFLQEEYLRSEVRLTELLVRLAAQVCFLCYTIPYISLMQNVFRCCVRIGSIL